MIQNSANLPLADLNRLLDRYSEYFPLDERPKMFDKGTFKHLAIKIFYEFFIKPNNDKFLEWEHEDTNQEQIACQMNYCNILECDDSNVKQLIEYLYESPADVIGALALSLDSYRFFK